MIAPQGADVVSKGESHITREISHRFAIVKSVVVGYMVDEVAQLVNYGVKKLLAACCGTDIDAGAAAVGVGEGLVHHASFHHFIASFHRLIRRAHINETIHYLVNIKIAVVNKDIDSPPSSYVYRAMYHNISDHSIGMPLPRQSMRKRLKSCPSYPSGSSSISFT